MTLVRDAAVAFDRGGMHAARSVNGPRFAHAILTTEQLLARLMLHFTRDHQRACDQASGDVSVS